MMDQERRTERAIVVWDSDTTCPCGSDPKADDGVAIDDESWHMDSCRRALQAPPPKWASPERDRGAAVGIKLTQAALARQLGVSRVTVARWETGVYAIPEPTARLLQRIRNERGEPRKRST